MVTMPAGPDQLLFVVGIGGGAWISFIFCADPAAMVLTEQPILPSFLGGFLALIGARFAKGTLDSHAISGLALLSSKSVIGAAVIFLSANVAGRFA